MGVGFRLEGSPGDFQAIGMVKLSPTRSPNDLS